MTAYDPTLHQDGVYIGSRPAVVRPVDKLIRVLDHIGFIDMVESDSAPGDTTKVWLDPAGGAADNAAVKIHNGSAWATATKDLLFQHLSGGSLEDVFKFKGGWSAAGGTFPGSGAAQTGWVYKVTTAGTVNGELFTVGDDIYAVTDNASTSTYAGNWLRIEGGLTGAEVRTALKAASSDHVTFEDFGAVGDGVTNDATALQAALDYSAANNTRIRVLGKTYLCGTTLTMAYGASMDGPGTIKATGTLTKLLQVGPTSGTSQATVNISGVTFDGNSTCSTAVVNCRNLQFSRIDCTVMNGSAIGFLTETDTSTINTKALRNFYSIHARSNSGTGMKFIGEKDTRFGELFANNNGSNGVWFQAFDNALLAETTECVVNSILARDNAGDGVVLDGTEKYAISLIQSDINGGWGLRFRSTYPSATSVGQNNASIGQVILRKNGFGQLRIADGAVVTGLQIAALKIIDYSATADLYGILMIGAARVYIGSLEVAGVTGTAVYMASGTVQGATRQTNGVIVSAAQIVGCGIVGSSQAHGIYLDNSTSNITFGRLVMGNSQTSGSNYELNISSSVTDFYIASANIISSSGNNAINGKAYVTFGDLSVEGDRNGIRYDENSGALVVGANSGAAGKLSFNGSSSGTATIAAQAAAGTPTLTIPTASGTIVASAGAPLSINSTTGRIDITMSALTKVDDTNVTLTLGGAPSAALLSATSLTLGWTGTLAMARGGTAASLTASNGGIVYSTASALAVLSGTATAGRIVRSGSNSAPSWSTATYPDTAGTSGNVIKSTGTNFTSTTLAASELSNGVTGSGAVVLAEGPTFTGGITTSAACTFNVPSNNIFAFNFNVQSAGGQVGFGFSDNGSSKWSLYKNSDNSINLYDNTNGANFLMISQGSLASGVIAFGLTADASSSTSAAVTVAGGLGVNKRLFATDLTVTNTPRINQAPSTIGTGSKTISNASSSSTNFGHYLVLNMNGINYYVPCSNVAPT